MVKRSANNASERARERERALCGPRHRIALSLSLSLYPRSTHTRLPRTRKGIKEKAESAPCSAPPFDSALNREGFQTIMSTNSCARQTVPRGVAQIGLELTVSVNQRVKFSMKSALEPLPSSRDLCPLEIHVTVSFFSFRWMENLYIFVYSSNSTNYVQATRILSIRGN